MTHNTTSARLVGAVLPSAALALAIGAAAVSAAPAAADHIVSNHVVPSSCNDPVACHGNWVIVDSHHASHRHVEHHVVMHAPHAPAPYAPMVSHTQPAPLPAPPAPPVQLGSDFVGALDGGVGAQCCGNFVRTAFVVAGQRSARNSARRFPISRHGGGCR